MAQQVGQMVDIKNCILLLKTCTTANIIPDVTFALRFGSGQLQFTEPSPVTYVGDRGKLDDVRFGDEVPMDVSFEGKFTFGVSRGGENVTVHEILKGAYRGNVASGSTANGASRFFGTRESWLANYGCPPYCCDLELHNNPKLLCANSLAYGEALLFRYFRAESLAVSLQSGMINVTGKAHIRQPQSQRLQFGYTTPETAVPLPTGGGASWALDPRAVGFGTYS